jgi:hypothetical protein
MLVHGRFMPFVAVGEQHVHTLIYTIRQGNGRERCSAPGDRFVLRAAARPECRRPNVIAPEDCVEHSEIRLI